MSYARYQSVKSANSSRRLLAAFDFATASHGRAIAFLTLCGLLFFLPGFFQIPPIDRDEARFAQATKQMVETGDYRRYPLPGRGPLQEAGRHLLVAGGGGETAAALGVPRAAGAHLALPHSVADRRDRRGALTYWAALAFVTRRGAALAGADDGASMLLGVEARLAKTDAMLLLTVVAAMGALARVYLSWQRGEDPAHPPWSLPAIFWTALAGGILLKGPLILMFVGLTIARLAILDRSARMAVAAAAGLGPDVAAVLVLPWFVAIFWRAGEPSSPIRSAATC